MDLLSLILIFVVLTYCIIREYVFLNREKFYLKKVDELTNKLMSRDYESYLYAQKKDWNALRPVREEKALMEDMGTLESFL